MLKHAAKLVLFTLLTLTLLSCGHRMDAVNWYLRIEHTEECDDFGLYGGEFSILCPINDAIWNGDSLVVKSGELCYFIDAENYKDHQPLETFDCERFEQVISIGQVYWANGDGPQPQ